MDAFFASIEERENPQFRGKPIVVGADPKAGRGRGVVSTANYEARKYGIHSALPISKAWQLCPEAVFLPVNSELYNRVSEKIMAILSKYSLTIEITSVDEAYLDLTDYSNILENLRILGREIGMKESYEKAKNLAKDIKEEIFEKEKLTCTIGIGPNKLIAKIASSKAKPDGLLVVKPDEVLDFLGPLDIEKIPGIGVKTAQNLRQLDINTVNDLRNISIEKLQELFGKTGKDFYEMARGIDERPVTSEEIIKSVGRQYTFEKDTRDPEMIFRVFDQLISEIGREQFSANFAYRTIKVVCRFRGFETHTKAKTLKEPSRDFKLLKREAKKLLLRFLLENPKLVRLIGVRVNIC
jgi:DNA polymerase IV (DinB-like DNA polymerase)